MDRLLVLVRHGQSEWNLKNLFTGWRDVDLSEQGVAEAKAAGQRLKAEGLTFGACYTSALTRAQRTLDLMLDELGQTGLPITRDQALNERDYGDLSGLNKDDARAKWGEEQVHVWRRSYATQPPGGESLRDTGARVWPYYLHLIQPHVMRGEGVQRDEKIGSQWLLLSARHGNTIAQNRVARLYAFGVGLSRDPVEAMKWNLLAARAGRADPELDTMLATLSDDLKAEAQARADAFRPEVPP